MTSIEYVESTVSQEMPSDGNCTESIVPQHEVCLISHSNVNDNFGDTSSREESNADSILHTLDLQKDNETISPMSEIAVTVIRTAGEIPTLIECLQLREEIISPKSELEMKESSTTSTASEISAVEELDSSREDETISPLPKLVNMESTTAVPEISNEKENVSGKSYFENTQSSNGLSSIYSHPAYKTLIRELAVYKEEINDLKSNINRLECENERLEADRSHDIFEVQIETLDKTISRQQNELHELKEASRQQTEILTNTFNHMKDELESKLEKMTKSYEAANKDRESTVMRYAMSEKEVIDQKRDRESLDKRLKETNKEKELLVSKIKGLTTDKSRVCQILDVKCNELTVLQKEHEKLKEDLNSREIKIKWAQNKLRTEMEMHKETQARVDQLTKKLQDTREEAEQVRRDCQGMMRTFQVSEENKACTLEHQLKELQAQLIMDRHDHQGKEETNRQLQQEMESYKKKHQLILNENNQLSIKVQNLEKERLENEQNISKLKQTMDDQKQNVVDLHEKLAVMESLRIQLQHEQERLSASQAEVERLRSSNTELQQDMTACREKEAELLDFTQKLTDKNVRLQSEFSATEAKAQELEFELGPQLRHVSELEAQVNLLSQQLEQEQRQRQEENLLLTRHLAESTQKADQLNQQFEDQLGENQVLKRKQISAVRELMRELQQTRKRLELYETTSGNSSLGQTSRASSSTSLNALEPNSTPSQSIAVKFTGQSSQPDSHNNDNEHEEPERHVLIEHIVKLQQANARKAEKLEFMEEHAQQLVEELQKKTRIVQSYILREQYGTLSSDTMDQNKAELSRHGGIMASLYNSKVVDDSMTFELSLEINRKLQAVLEDTLLKNITLKDSIETLGTEIGRLQNKLAENLS